MNLRNIAHRMEERNKSPNSPDKKVDADMPNGTSAAVKRSPSSRPCSERYFVQTVNLAIMRDAGGHYGMHISGDRPVYVQIVKPGGAAEKAGLHCGDKILKVNGIDVTQSTHTQVVEMIKSKAITKLTVQHRFPPASLDTTASPPSVTPSSPLTPPSSSTDGSPPSFSSPTRPLHHHNSAPARDRITSPIPVDREKHRQFECQRVQTFRLMLEKEQRYMDGLRSELAKCADTTHEHQVMRELMGAERRVRTLQEQLLALTSHLTPPHPTSPSPVKKRTRSPLAESKPPPPPPLSTLPSRAAFNHSFSDGSLSSSPTPPLPSRVPPIGGHAPPPPPPPMGGTPPPLPPRQYLKCLSTDESDSRTEFSSSSSPLPTNHIRTKSSPEDLIQDASALSEGVANRLSGSGSLTDLSTIAKRCKGVVSWDVDLPLQLCTPPGTPPPPYGGDTAAGTPSPPDDSPPPIVNSIDEADVSREGPVSPLDDFLTNRNSTVLLDQTPPIISMEDDDMSDQDMSHAEDHGPFKRLSSLIEHSAHLAVFLNYVISNADPSSLLFYLLTDLYKEGNAKEMKKWAYEIHSSFLVPGAPLRLNNVDEKVARKIDEVLLNESDKEEELRKVFHKAREKAKQELNELLADFRQKRTAGLGTIFGPADTTLDETIHDKTKEMKICEQILVPKMEPFADDVDKTIDDRRFTTAAALGTILSKIFGIRGPQYNYLLERWPTYVSKEKSFRAKLIGRSRKVTIRGHQFVAHQYFTVTHCNHCHLIIWGVGPQGYQCTHCLLNVHRPCVKTLDENCPGPLIKKDKANDRISKLMEKIRPEREQRRKPTPAGLTQMERLKKQATEEEGSSTDNETGGGGERLTSGVTCNNAQASSGSASRVDPMREVPEDSLMGCAPLNYPDESRLHNDLLNHNLKRNKGTTINRSESYKERLHQKKQIREKRKTSDPNLSKTQRLDTENEANMAASYSITNSASSSNSNLSSRSLDSPSTSLEVVANGKADTSNTSNNIVISSVTSAWDSDTEAEQDPPDWTKGVPEEILTRLTPTQKKTQEVLNELFHTERSHVRALKILDQLFYQPLRELQLLPAEQLSLLFPNLDQMLELHSTFNNNMKQRKREKSIVEEVGDILLKMFDGAEGEIFQMAAATFCSRQQIALEALKERRKRDAKLHHFLCEAEANPICRRLQLKDIIPAGMLRLTKYPLLFENLVKYIDRETEEWSKVQRALEKSKDILNHVNRAIKEAEDQHRLAEIQKRLDKAPFEKVDHPVANEFKNLDLTKHRLIHEGSLNWRVQARQKTSYIDLHVLLLEDVIVLLQKGSDEKFVLKFYKAGDVSGTDRTPILSPIIKISTLIVRPNNTDKENKSLFLVNTSSNCMQIYDFVATSTSEQKTWYKHISEAAESFKNKEGKQHRHRGATPSSSFSINSSSSISTPDEPDTNPADSNTHNKENDDSFENERNSKICGVNTNWLSPDDRNPHSPLHAEINKRSASPSPRPARKKATGAAASPLSVGRLTTESNTLIEPCQVVVSERPVLTAEPVITPYEILRRKDEVIKEALREKQQLVAEILKVPNSEQIDNADDLTKDTQEASDASELLFSAVTIANRLSEILSDGLHVTEEEAIIMSSEVRGKKSVAKSAAVTPKLREMATSLNSQLTRLVEVMANREQERDRLRHELQRSREQLHAMHEAHQRVQRAIFSDVVDSCRPANDVSAIVDMESTSSTVPTCSLTN